MLACADPTRSTSLFEKNNMPGIDFRQVHSLVTKKPLHQAALDLCQRLDRDVPWLPTK